MDRFAFDRRGRLRYDGVRNVPRLGRYAGRIEPATAAADLDAFDYAIGTSTTTRDAGPDVERTSLSVSRADGSARVDAAVSAAALRLLDDVRERARWVAASWEDPYLGYYARESGLDTLDILTIEDASPGNPIAYGRTTRVDPCVPRGLSDRAVSRGRLVRVGSEVRYEPERSEFDPSARPIAVRLVRDGLALRGDARERTYVRSSQAAYLARLDRFQASVDAQRGAPCGTR